MVLTNSIFDPIILNAKSLVNTDGAIKDEIKNQIKVDKRNWVFFPEEKREVFLSSLKEDSFNKIFQISVAPANTFVERFNALSESAKYITVTDDVSKNKLPNILSFLQQEKEKRNLNLGLAVSPAPALDVLNPVWDFYFLNITLLSSQTYNSAIAEINATTLPTIGYVSISANDTYSTIRTTLEYAKMRLLNLAGYSLDLSSKNQYDEVVGILNSINIDLDNIKISMEPIHDKIKKVKCFAALCDACNRACPKQLFPKETLAYFFRGRTFGKDKEKIILTGTYCDNCGICDKVCPALIPIGSKYFLAPVHLEDPE